MMMQRRTVWILAAALAVVLIVAVVIVLNVMQSNRGSFTRGERADMERQLRLKIDGCREAQDPAICARQVVVPQAELLKDAQLCLLLEGDARIECVVSIATLTMDRGDCGPLLGEDQDRCRDVVGMATASGGLDVEACRAIKSEENRTECVEQVTSRVVDQGSCAEYGVNVALCDERDIFNQAVSKGDVATCDRLSNDEAIQSCRETVGQDIPDPDEVGGASVAIDSDGDGYSDEVEIRNGFDPYGPGRL